MHTHKQFIMSVPRCVVWIRLYASDRLSLLFYENEEHMDTKLLGRTVYLKEARNI